MLSVNSGMVQGKGMSSIQDKILFVCYGGGHSAALLPVIKRLRNREVDVAVLGLTTAKQAIERAGISTLDFSALIGRVRPYRRAPYVGSILAKAHASHPVVSLRDTAAYLGVGFHALVRDHGLVKAKEMYALSGRQIFLPTDFFIELFKKERPRLVVSTNSPRSERAALEAARELGIPSVCLVDLYAYYEIEWCASDRYASKVCVLNQQVCERFERAGLHLSRISVTGNPAFDRLAHIDRSQCRRMFRHRLGIEESQSLVVWISQPEPSRHPFSGVLGDENYPVNVEKYLFEAFGDDPDVHLIMRLHPSESRPPAIVADRVHYSDSSEALDHLLCAADCIVTASSTVGLEAAYLGLPVIQCMDSIFSHDLPLAELGVARAVETHRDLGGEIRDVLDRPLELQRPHLFDGGAAARVEAVILELLEGGV